jgi:hypothetical protein
MILDFASRIAYTIVQLCEPYPSVVIVSTRPGLIGSCTSEGNENNDGLTSHDQFGNHLRNSEFRR